MKDLKEFKYQHQLDETNHHRKPRSKMGLISGMLLGMLAIGVLWPVGTKWVAKERSAAHAMPAKKLIARNEVTRPIDIRRVPTQDKITRMEKIDTEEEITKPTSPVLPTKKVALEIPATKMKALAAVAEAKPVKPQPSPKVVKVASVASVKKPVSKALSSEKRIQIAKLDAPQQTLPTVHSTELVEEGETVLSADEVQAKTDAVLLKAQGVSDTVASNVHSETIVNAQYEKSTLSGCKARCLLKAKDAEGHAISAIISGPNFADILAEHNGTINITGKKTKVKNHEVFMVQSITFNLPAPKAAGQTGKPAPTQIKKDVLPNRPYTGTPEAYEDLSSDPLPIR